MIQLNQQIRVALLIIKIVAYVSKKELKKVELTHFECLFHKSSKPSY